MTQEQTDITKELFEKALEYAKTTENFVAEQSPLIAQEIIKWGIYYNLFCAILLLVLVIVIGFIFYKLFPRVKKGFEDEDVFIALGGGLLGFGLIIINVVFIFDIFFYGKTFMMAVLTPRLYLIQEITKML